VTCCHTSCTLNVNSYLELTCQRETAGLRITNMGHLELYIVHGRQKQNAMEPCVHRQEFHASSEAQALRQMECALAEQGYDPRDWEISAHTKAEDLTCPEHECPRTS
jgi:hypothetical protein